MGGPIWPPCSAGLGAGLWDPAFGYYLRSYLGVLVIGCVTATPLCAGLWPASPNGDRP